MKLTQSKAALQANPRMGWAEDLSPDAIKAIGLLEVLAAVGLVVPGLTGILPVLVALAAVGLAVMMVGAFAVHARRGERDGLPVNLVPFVLAAAFRETRPSVMSAYYA